MTISPENLTELCDGIVDARTISKPERLALVQEIKQHGLTPAILERLGALFAAEEAAARAGIEVLDRQAANLNGQLAEEEERIAPDLQQNSASFVDSARALVAEAGRDMNAVEAEFEAGIKGGVADADAAAADAIRESLKPKQ